MPPRTDPTRSRVHPLLVVAGITIGILTLFFVQFAIPYLLGPFGLVVVAFLDLGIYLWIRHTRLVRRQPGKYSRIVWGPVDRRYVARHPRPLEAEVAATFVFLVFLIALYIIGFAVRIESWWFASDLPLYIVGSIMTSIAVFLSRAYRYDYYLRSESERYDTTEDH